METKNLTILAIAAIIMALISFAFSIFTMKEVLTIKKHLTVSEQGKWRGGGDTGDMPGGAGTHAEPSGPESPKPGDTAPPEPGDTGPGQPSSPAPGQPTGPGQDMPVQK